MTQTKANDGDNQITICAGCMKPIEDSADTTGLVNEKTYGIFHTKCLEKHYILKGYDEA